MAKKILIIDDNEKIVGMLAEFLGRHGYDTCCASDGVEGFEMVHKEAPDLIILDLQLRDGWGSRFFRMFTEEEGFKHVPLIVKSGRQDTYIPVEKAVAAFVKPFNVLELLDVVEKTIGK